GRAPDRWWHQAGDKVCLVLMSGDGAGIRDWRTWKPWRLHQNLCFPIEWWEIAALTLAGSTQPGLRHIAPPSIVASASLDQALRWKSSLRRGFRRYRRCNCPAMSCTEHKEGF